MVSCQEQVFRTMSQSESQKMMAWPNMATVIKTHDVGTIMAQQGNVDLGASARRCKNILGVNCQQEQFDGLVDEVTRAIRSES